MKYNRREFLKMSGMAVVGVAVVPHLLQSCAAGVPESASATMNHFGVSAEDLKKVINTALEKGGEYADLFFEHTFYNSVTLRDNKVNSTYSNIDFGMGVRVVVGEQTGYAYVEEVTLEEMLKAAKTAARIASGNAKKGANNINVQEFKNYYPVQKSWEDITIQQKAPYLQKLNDRIFDLDHRVSKVIVSLSDTSSVVMFYNSEGEFFNDYRPMTTLSATCIMEQNGEIENGGASRAFMMGYEFLNDDIVEQLAQEAVKKTSILFTAIQPKGGEMPVVMGAGGSGILLHEAIGHAFEADFNRKNTSIFSDKLGKKICSEVINVVDDGTIPYNRGSVNIDDEGVLGQKTYIVKEGILNSYLHDRMSAKYYGLKSTGNGRRESFRHMPIPRMRATYMENGNVKEADMIADVKYGVYCDVFTNGQVQIGAGDFTFFVKSGYLIENGKFTQPIKDINIIGNGPQALADIVMVADNLSIDNGTWTCGKNGQSCPVTCGMPAALVSKLTVGGE
ncbi:MAG: TldD/PmbA family protein [Bacteroidales bacterium]|jgi:TldD protein|nr:TldD/PmbA family protein [Bacteroidales bacterium]